MFETTSVLFRAGSDARWKEIRDLARGEDRLLGGSWPIAVLALEDGGRLEARRASSAPGGLRIEFGPGPGEASRAPRSILLGLEVREEAVVFELRSDPGEGVAKVEFANAPLAIEDRVGAVLNAAWDERFAAALLGLDADVECAPERVPGGAVLRAHAWKRFAFAGRRAALVAGPPSELRRRIRAVEEAFGIPGTSGDGPPVKDLESARRSYLFLTDMTEAAIDRAVEAAIRGGFGCVMVTQTSWSRTTGHYLFDERRFPSGIEGLAEMARRFHAAGLQAGLHIWASKVSKNDPYATPVPDRRLFFDRRTALAEAIDERAASLEARDPVSDWPGGTVARAYEGREADHCDLIIDDEIIRYEGAGRDGDAHAFAGLVRGAYGTRAAPHAAGTPILHPKIDGCIPGYVVDQDSGILEEIAERVAGLIDGSGFDMVYFDGGEDVPPPLWRYATKFQLAVLERTRRRPLIHQGTILTHFLWHSFARTNTVDIATSGVKAHIDRSVKGLEACRANFIPGELGWFGLWPPSGSNPGLRTDEVEYLLARSLAHDAPISIETSLAAIEAHPLSGTILDLVRTYENLRLHREIPEEALAPARASGPDFALLLPERRLAAVEPPLEIAGGIRACIGEDGGGSFAILSRAGRRGELALPIGRDALELRDLEGRPLEVAGDASRARLRVGPERLRLRARGLEPGELRAALETATFDEAEAAAIWIPASDFREISGAMDFGGAFGIFDGGALGPFLVPAAVPAGAAREPPEAPRASAAIQIPEEGTWYAWAHVRYPVAVDRSFWLDAQTVDRARSSPLGAPFKESRVLGNCGRNGGAWHWTGRGDGLATVPPGAPIPLRLPAGRVRISIAPREGGSDPASNPRFDVLCLADDPSFRPDDALARRALEGRAPPAAGGRARPHPAGAIRVSVAAQAWSEEGRTLGAVLELLELARREAPDIVLLPQECVAGEPEPIPGPTSEAIARKAREIGAYVVGCIRERDAERTFVTSFLADRAGRIAGKYRKSHKLPDEDLDLGDELPVFSTDFGEVAMKIGSDRHFPEIDLVYAAKGARLVLWSQAPEPVEDEHLQDFPAQGRAADFGIAIACARYAPAGPGWITNFYPPYCGSPIGRSWVADREGQRIASTPRRPGVATATIGRAELKPGRSPSRNPRFPALAAPVALPEPRSWAKRVVRVAAIEGHVGTDELLERLDEAGRLGTDVACTYEFVWIHGPEEETIRRETEAARRNLERVREKAREHRMYVIVAGVIERIERNGAIVYDREGRELGRYCKVAKTHSEQIPGEAAPVFETDFGRIAVRICADEWYAELDRSYALAGADIVFVPTQSRGPDAIFRELRDASRAMDGGCFLVECTHASTEVRHRSRIIDPTGFPVAASSYRKPGIVTAVLDLDRSRPLRYLRVYDPHEPKRK